MNPDANLKRELAILSLTEAISLSKRAKSKAVSLIPLKVVVVVVVVVAALGASPLAAIFSAAPLRQRKARIALTTAEAALASLKHASARA